MATVSVLDLKRRQGESNITNAKKKKSKQVFIQIKSVVTYVQNQSVTGIFFRAYNLVFFIVINLKS